MKILGPRFLGRLAGNIVNSHPALLPSFPGAHGAADALAHGVKVTGTTVHPRRRRGVDTGPDPRTASRADRRRRRHRGHPARTDQDHRARTARRHGDRPGRQRCWLPKDERPASRERLQPTAVDPSAGARECSTTADLLELAATLHAAGVEIVSTGSTAKTIADNGVPGHRGVHPHRLRECLEGRVKTRPQGARRHPRRHPQERSPRPARRPGVEAFELVVVNLYPFTQTVASGASQDEVSSRSTSADRRWCAVPPRIIRRWPWWSTQATTTTCVRPSTRADSPSHSGNCWRPRLSGTPQTTT